MSELSSDSIPSTASRDQRWSRIVSRPVIGYGSSAIWRGDGGGHCKNRRWSDVPDESAGVGSVALMNAGNRGRMHMETNEEMSERIDHAERVQGVLQAFGWIVTAVGVAGALVFIGFWIVGYLNAEQAVSLILGTTLATILSGASVYGAGVNVGLGAARLALQLEAARPSGPAVDGAPGA